MVRCAHVQGLDVRSIQFVTGRNNVQRTAEVVCRTRHKVNKAVDGENFSQLTCVGVGCFLEVNVSVADDKHRIDECCEAVQQVSKFSEKN